VSCNVVTSAGAPFQGFRRFGVLEQVLFGDALQDLANLRRGGVDLNGTETSPSSRTRSMGSSRRVMPTLTMFSPKAPISEITQT